MARTIDFQTMRENCIQIHQETYELFLVADKIGEEINLVVKSADELRTSETTKTWDGMGRFAKELHDNAEVWDRLPDTFPIILNGIRKTWNKAKAKQELQQAYLELGGKNLYKQQ